MFGLTDILKKVKDVINDNDVVIVGNNSISISVKDGIIVSGNEISIKGNIAIVDGKEYDLEKPYHINITGNVESVTSICPLVIQENCGSVEAGTSVSCKNVEGDVKAGQNVECENVQGSVKAGQDVKCNDVKGDVKSGMSVKCGKVEGNVKAGMDVNINS